MKITKDSYVTCEYELYTGEGQDDIVEKATPEVPLALIVGEGFLLEAFEKQLMGLEAGDKFDFTLTPEEAYGEISDEYILELEKDLFKNEEGEFHSDVVFEGNAVPMLDNQGNQLIGIVEEITDDKVTMNFNHPLAGQTLHFIGSVLEARPATEEDRERLTAQFSGHAGGCCDGDHEGGCSCCGGGCH